MRSSSSRRAIARRTAVGGHLVTSGVLRSQQARVRAAYAQPSGVSAPPSAGARGSRASSERVAATERD
jgi:hypothetical protein